ncbi:MAG: hypothetical protein AAGA10_30195 [Bacteroidota bacterium]
MNESTSRVGTRRSAEQMYPLMAIYASGGQSRKDFCSSHGLKPGTFQYWWQRYRGDQQGEMKGFVALSPTEGKASGIELHYGSVRLYLGGVSSEYLAQLVQTLAGPC